MSTKKPTRSVNPKTGTVIKRRRHFLAATLGIVTGVFTWCFKPEGKTPSLRSLKEADFYKSHDLAG